MIKIIGFGMLVFLSIFFFGFLIVHLYIEKGIHNYSFFSIEWIFFLYGLIFIKFITVDNEVVRVYRPFWFLMQRNSIKIEDIGKVKISLVTAPGGSTTFVFYDKEGDIKLQCFTAMYKFEVRKFIKEMKKHEVEITVTGSGSYGFDY